MSHWRNANSLYEDAFFSELGDTVLLIIVVPIAIGSRVELGSNIDTMDVVDHKHFRKNVEYIEDDLCVSGGKTASWIRFRGKYMHAWRFVV